MPLIFDEPLLLKLTELRIQDDELLEQRQWALVTCLEQLKPHQRAAIERYYHRPGTIKSMAEDEGRSTTAVYKMLERIRAILHACIDRKLALES